jgi:hypothetical protein
MGVNSAGFAIGNASSSIVATVNQGFSIFSSDILEEDMELEESVSSLLYSENLSFQWPYNPATTPVFNSGMLTINTLANCSTVQDFRDHLQEIFSYGNSTIQSCVSDVDAVGGSSMFEICWNTWWREYAAANPNRIAQSTYGFVVRENSWHNRLDGTDNLAVTGDRFESGTYNLRGMLAEKGFISLRMLARGTSDPGTGYEYYRYGPGRELAPLADPRNRASVIVHGVLPSEDPTLATMWVGLGPSNYTIYVPTWVMIRTVPLPLQYNSSNDEQYDPGVNHMYDRSLSLFYKGNEQITQQSTYPFEEHIFSEVIDGLLPHWRTFGTPSRDTMERICHRITNDAYSLLHCLDLVRYDNKAPVVDFSIMPDGMTLHFTLNASDPDGQIASILWNFGDNTTSTLNSPSRTYNQPGDYLISCTVTDNEGVSNTKWVYFKVPFICDLTGDNKVTVDDLTFLGESWLNACSEPFWCDGCDLNNSRKVDLTDLNIISNYWITH